MSTPTNDPTGRPGQPWPSPSAPRSWHSGTPEAPADPYGPGPYGTGTHGSGSYGSGTYGPAPSAAEAAGAGFGTGLGGPQQPEPSGRDDRRRPGWAALVAVGAGAALVASLGTAGLTGAFDDEAAAPQTQTSAGPTDSPSADPVVTSTTDDPDWANVADAVRPSVVAIQVQTGGGGTQGSGVILDEQGNILTNDHVVGDAVEDGILVTLADGRQYRAEIAGLDPTTDLAVITLVDGPDGLRPATLGSSDDVVVGDPVMAVGNPLGLASTVTTGIVSALDRPVTTSEEQQQPGEEPSSVTINAVQVDAAINPGNSGGPLFDATGRVIGITSSIAGVPGAQASGSIGLGFAIPVDLAAQIAEQLIEDGQAQHAYLGVYTSDGSAEIDGVQRSGARIEEVEPGTPAAQAGLQAGDVVVGIGEDDVTGAESLTGFVRQYSSGDEVTLTVVRGGEQVELTATLATLEEQG